MTKKRSIKVYGKSGYKYQETPTIMLKGKWLNRERGDEHVHAGITSGNQHGVL